MTPWQVLGIDPTPDERDIKRAYAKRLKQTRPDEDKEGFLQLRAAYEQALELRRWVRAEVETGNPEDDTSPPPVTALPETLPTPAEAEPAAAPPPAPPATEPPAPPESDRAPSPVPPPVPAPIRVHWHFNPTPDQPAPTVPVQPARTRTDYRRGWKSASRQSEEALTDRIRTDLEEPALVHLEARADYERDLLAWLLKHKQVWPRVFRMALETLHWQEKQRLWPEWPWSQLESYHRRCQLHALFADPDRFRQDSPALCDWLKRNPGPAANAGRHAVPTLLLKRADLNRELVQFRAAYGDLLHYEPEGRARLEALEQTLKRFPLEKAVGFMAGLFLGGGLLQFSLEDSERLYLFLISLTLLGLATFVAWGLARDFVLPGFRTLLARVLQPPSILVIASTLTLGLVTGIPSALLRWQMPHLADGLREWLEFSGAMLILCGAMLWNRLSDWLAHPPERFLGWLSLSAAQAILLGLTGFGLPVFLLNADLPVLNRYPWLTPVLGLGVALPAILWWHACRVHRRFGPGIPRRFLAYLMLVAADVTLLILDNLRQGGGPSGGLLLFGLLLLLPLLIRTESRPRASGDRGMASLFLMGIFLVHQIIAVVISWALLHDKHLTGLAGLLVSVYIPFYILAHDPKQD